MAACGVRAVATLNRRCHLEPPFQDATTDGKMPGDIFHLDSLARMLANPLGHLGDPRIVYRQHIGRLPRGDA